MMRKLFNDETGAVVSAELILILTITFCAAAVGWSTIGAAIVTELNDVSEMIGTVDQSYKVSAFQAPAGGLCGIHGQCASFGFNDMDDECDCKGLIHVQVCGKTQTANETGGTGNAESP